MRPVRRISIIDQTADHIREGIDAGRWVGKLPGLRPLSQELAISRESLRAAIRRLEAEGRLLPGESGEPRTILGGAPTRAGRIFRVAILPARGMENESIPERLLILTLMRALEAAGHECSLVSPPPDSGEQAASALSRLVATKQADAWFVLQASRPALDWFSSQPAPLLAIGGNSAGLPASSIDFDYNPAIIEAVRLLVAFGHERIVFITPKFARSPAPSRAVHAFLAELTASGIVAGEFNSPDWTESPAGLRALLESLFKFTPPSAIITWDGLVASGVLAFLAGRGLTVPDDISLVSLTSDSAIPWQNPSLTLANCAQDADAFVRHCVRWVNRAAAGESELESKLLAAAFVPGDTLGPAKRDTTPRS